MVSNFANVVVDFGAGSVRDRLFTYKIPESLLDSVTTGVSVLIPFGKAQAISGYVVSVGRQVSPGFKNESQIKEILAVLSTEPFFDSQYIDFLKWVADYYSSSLMDVLTAALPACLTPRLKQTVRLVREECHQDSLNKSERAILDLITTTVASELPVSTLKQRWRKNTGEKDSHFYRAFNLLIKKGLIERHNEIAPASKARSVDLLIWTGKEVATPKQRKVLTVLQEKGGQLDALQLAKEAGVSRALITSLVKANILLVKSEDLIRNPLAHLQAGYLSEQREETDLPKLTIDQQNVYSALSKVLIESFTNKTLDSATDAWLLHGVTGSGKTEIYLRLIAQALQYDRSALLMVPEIALTPQLAKRLVERFGQQVAVWHSGLSDGERYDTWRRLQSGELKILLGARSAILVDMPTLGLIVIDEEHDGSYKQSSPPPRYNAKTLAFEKAKRSGALVLLGSATPDISTYYSANKQNKILSLPKRVFNQGFPETIFVDMRKEFATGNRSIFSQPLTESLQTCFDRKEQVILLMNRRGYASHVFCRGCGYVSVCKNCSVAMVYHRLIGDSRAGKDAGQLICHHCGYQLQMAHICPACEGPFLKHYGLGTQKVEIDLKELLPEAKVLRMDSDTVKVKGAHEKIFQQFTSGQADILIGTQMVAKGLDNENVTLVGILAADAAFNLPDYRSTERGFQLLTQVAGRAGRGKFPGKVILQTFNPDLPALKFSQAHDYMGFYSSELAARQEFSYPPFSQLIRIVIASTDMEKTEQATEYIAEALSHFLADTVPIKAMTILGPAPCLLERLHGKYRQHLIIKNNAGEEGQKLIASFFKEKTVADVQIAVDIDAVDLL